MLLYPDDRGRAIFWSRNGKHWTQKFLNVVEAIKSLIPRFKGCVRTKIQRKRLAKSQRLFNRCLEAIDQAVAESGSDTMSGLW